MKADLVMAVLVLFGSFSIQGKPLDGQMVQGPGFEGVIFTPEMMRHSQMAPYSPIESWWVPSKLLVMEAEKALRGAIAKKVKIPKHRGPNFPQFYTAKNGTNLHFTDDPPDLIYDSEYADDFLYDLSPYLAKYKRQYVGATIKGRKLLLLSFIYDPDSWRPRPSGFEEWRNKWIEVLDGGDSFWRVLYDPVTKTFSDWECNGYASAESYTSTGSA